MFLRRRHCPLDGVRHTGLGSSSRRQPARGRASRPPLTAGTPPPRRWRAGLLPRLVTRTGHPRHARTGRRHPQVHRGMLPDRQRRGRPRPAPGPQMDLLVPLHPPVMVAHALLAVIAAHEGEQRAEHEPGLIPLTVNEIRHPFAKLITNSVRIITNSVRTISHWAHWSQWRRQHQARAKTSHYARRNHTSHRQPST